MGFFSRSTSVEPYSTLGSSDTLPATSGTLKDRIAAGGSAAVDKATQIYKENPKLVSGIALVASALLLNRLRGTTM